MILDRARRCTLCSCLRLLRLALGLWFGPVCAPWANRCRCRHSAAVLLAWRRSRCSVAFKTRSACRRCAVAQWVLSGPCGLPLASIFALWQQFLTMQQAPPPGGGLGMGWWWRGWSGLRMLDQAGPGGRVARSPSRARSLPCAPPTPRPADARYPGGRRGGDGRLIWCIRLVPIFGRPGGPSQSRGDPSPWRWPDRRITGIDARAGRQPCAMAPLPRALG